MKRILFSLLTVVVLGGLGFGVTRAFFSDRETSSGNSFTAGDLDLRIDNTSYLNGVEQPNNTWQLSDLTDQLFFSFTDLKPGDVGEDTVSLHVTNNSWMCVDMKLTANDDVTCTPTELVDDPDCTASEPGTGELAQNLNFMFWSDDGDNVLEIGERVMTTGDASTVLNGVRLPLADKNGNNLTGVSGPLLSTQTYFIGKAWCFGNMTADPVAPGANSPTVNPGVTCDGSLVQNGPQTDMMKADVSFYAEQARNNPDFVCGAFPANGI